MLTHQDQFRAVQANHDLIPPAIEERLRFEAPLTTVQRIASEDTEPEGVRILTRIGGLPHDDARQSRPPPTLAHYRLPVPSDAEDSGP